MGGDTSCPTGPKEAVLPTSLDFRTISIDVLMSRDVVIERYASLHWEKLVCTLWQTLSLDMVWAKCANTSVDRLKNSATGLMKVLDKLHFSIRSQFIRNQALY